MGAARKLQNEIEGVLKKVKEGVASFDDTHSKVCVPASGQLLVCVHSQCESRLSRGGCTRRGSSSKPQANCY